MSQSPRMQERDFVLSVIGLGAGNKEFGRTSLQKVAYLASFVLGRDSGHDAYFYGPYSSDVEADTDALVLSGLVVESRDTLGINDRGFQVKRYTYEVTEDGEERISRIAAAYPEEIGRLTAFVEQLHDVVGSYDQGTLSAAAKTLYIAVEQDAPVSVEEIQALGRDHNWALSAPIVAKVVEVLKNLDLVQAVDAP